MSEIVNNSITTPNFTEAYPAITRHVLASGAHLPSRVGDMVEVLDFKTEIQNPIQRCVGGAGRNINVFFLLAESIWIWSGRNDLNFLKMFNKQMASYSDDGRTFNAPYGFRLRYYGRNSSQTFLVDERDDAVLRRYSGEDFEEVKFHMDQISWVLDLLHKDPSTRRAVATIWNPEFDTKESSDIPCNDLLMFKVRDGKLHLTIANRSNDLHWGLCTNVFQFSFILELMAEILGLEVGRQVHNSQSLHIYDENPITQTILDNGEIPTDIYSLVSASKMGFNDTGYLPKRIERVDELMKNIMADLSDPNHNNRVYPWHLKKYWGAPLYFKEVLKLLCVYVEYTHTTRTEQNRIQSIVQLKYHWEENSAGLCEDYYLLAINWFAQRVPEDKVYQAIGDTRLFKNIPNEWLGKL
jgi:thymidylate synthase